MFSNDINLAYNTHLRSLSLNMFHCDSDEYPFTCQWVIALLAQMSSPYLEELCLYFYLEDISRLNIIDWTQLANLFNQQKWSNLDTLLICWEGLPEGSESTVSEFLKAQFPVLDSHGILISERGSR